jgi:hypothetical protein
MAFVESHERINVSRQSQLRQTIVVRIGCQWSPRHNSRVSHAYRYKFIDKSLYSFSGCVDRDDFAQQHLFVFENHGSRQMKDEAFPAAHFLQHLMRGAMPRSQSRDKDVCVSNDVHFDFFNLGAATFAPSTA